MAAAFYCTHLAAFLSLLMPHFMKWYERRKLSSVERTLVWCRVFQPTKNAFVDTLQSVLDDVKWSLLFLALTMWGFAGAFHILFREDHADYEVR